MKRKKLVSIVAAVLAFLLVLTLVLSIIPSRVFAASSSSIKQELKDLEAQAQEIEKAKKDLESQQAANASNTEDVVSRKKDIDQEIKIIHDEINNINAQIQSYNQLIAEKQKELDDAQTRQQELNERYRVRLRTMEENGKVSYWSVLFKAKSFTDLLDSINMISEIAAADRAMMEQLDQVAQEILTAQADLAEEKAGLQTQKDALADSQAELDLKSAEADEILSELIDDAAQMAEAYESYESQEASLSDEIAQKEKEFNEALDKEEEARRQQQQQQQQNNSGGGSSGGGNSGGGSTSSSGWQYPLPYATVTCGYGWRTHPITGKQSFHNGVDLGAAQGTPIYASRSGTVTTATYSSVYGYYVTINHGDGYSTLYGHMTHYTVSAGQTVSQGEVIGYVGSTGWSTGPHLHFTIYYNGSTVNPMNYI